MDERKKLEQAFHNTREEVRKTDKAQHDAVYRNRRFYDLTGASTQHIDQWLDAHLGDVCVLDFCCGSGGMALRLGQRGARVVGFDISDVSVASARALCADEDLRQSPSFFVGDAEQCALGSGVFDVVVATGVLHHVDLDLAYAEIARVLKPDGVALCVEALAHNPLIMRYRRRTPELRTAFEVDHILTVQEIRRAKKHFDTVDIRFFHLADLAAIPLIGTRWLGGVLRLTSLLDRVILRIPYVRTLAWQAVFTLERPRQVRADA